MQVSWAEEEGPGLFVWRGSVYTLDMEIAEKENVLLTICLINERQTERESQIESLTWLPSVGGHSVCRIEGAKRWLIFQTKNSPSCSETSSALQ